MTYGQPTVEAGPPRSAVHPPQQHSVHQTQSAHPQQPVGGQGGLQQQRSFSSSEEERSTPECASDEPDESEKGESILDISSCCFFFPSTIENEIFAISFRVRFTSGRNDQLRLLLFMFYVFSSPTRRYDFSYERKSTSASSILSFFFKKKKNSTRNRVADSGKTALNKDRARRRTRRR